MRQDNLTVRKLLAGAHGDHIHRRARSLVWVVDHGLRQTRVDLCRVGRMRWVYKDDAFATVELGPDGLERLVA